MISKEKYKKTLVRMWDSVRDDYYKGEHNCGGVGCVDCPLTPVCSDKAIDYYEAIEFVEKWDKEHPIETNGTRFLKNYPKAKTYDYNDGLVYIELDSTNKLLDTDNCTIFPKTWWEREVDNDD